MTEDKYRSEREEPQMGAKSYLLWTFVMTWGCWWIEAVLLNLGVLEPANPIAMILFLLGGFGPTIAAFLCSKQR